MLPVQRIQILRRSTTQPLAEPGHRLCAGRRENAGGCSTRPPDPVDSISSRQQSRRKVQLNWMNVKLLDYYSYWPRLAAAVPQTIECGRG